jgi:hypothetical protein
VAKKNNSDSTVAGGLFVIFILIAIIPKQVWIGLGIAAAIALVTWVVYKVVIFFDERKAAAEKQARADAAAEAARVKRQREEHARKVKQERINALGAANAARVDSAQAAVKRVVASEAARAGWLGDVDFTADITGITESFRKVHALRKVADQLSALDNRSADDQRILDEAKSTAANLEGAAIERGDLIEKCATEAKLVDESLHAERVDARTAEQRAALHAKLSSMLYGIEAAPDTTPANSAADAVMARVQAYREIKNQIQQSRAL